MFQEEMEKKETINKNEMKKYLEKRIRENFKEGVLLLNLGCFYDINCNIERCKSPDYNQDRGTGACCEHYENKCKPALNSLLENI